MSYGIVAGTSAPWRATGACYSQRRLMLWAHRPATATLEGRRFVPPTETTAGTQPGRERPHPRRCAPDPSARQGVAHVPAAESTSSAHSARGRLVLCTRDSRPTFNPAIVTQTASLSGGVRELISA
jgi:hypothetical protein